MKKLLNLWAVLTLAVSGTALFIFSYVLLFDSLTIYEYNLFILIPEFLIALFMFVMSFYVAWNILLKRKEIELK